MIIVADAGGSKTDWWVKRGEAKGEILETGGINVSVHSGEHIEDVLLLLREKLEFLGIEPVSGSAQLFFYGAGCNSENVKQILRDKFAKIFPSLFNELKFHSDLEGAARALFKDEKGITCIIGTGSASGLYNGKEIAETIPSLGFILGDEGSGAYMGKRLINAFYKRDLPEEIKVKLEAERGMEMADIIRRTYREKEAGKFLASFIPFIKENENLTAISEIIDESLKLFFINNVLKYKRIQGMKIGFVGGVACAFEDRLRLLSQTYGFETGGFLKRPIECLGEFYETHYDD